MDHVIIKESIYKFNKNKHSCKISIFEFLWDGPAKIKQNVVIKQYCEVGPRWTNLKAFIT